MKKILIGLAMGVMVSGGVVRGMDGGPIGDLKKSLTAFSESLEDLSDKLQSKPLCVLIQPGDTCEKAVEKDWGVLLENLESKKPLKVVVSTVDRVFDTKVKSSALNILLVAGGHGDYDSLFDRSIGVEYLKNNIVEPLKKQGVHFDFILVEACLSGFVMSAFKELLKENGLLVGSLVTLPGYVVTYTILKKIHEKGFGEINKKFLINTISALRNNVASALYADPENLSEILFKLSQLRHKGEKFYEKLMEKQDEPDKNYTNKEISKLLRDVHSEIMSGQNIDLPRAWMSVLNNETSISWRDSIEQYKLNDFIQKVIRVNEDLLKKQLGEIEEKKDDQEKTRQFGYFLNRLSPITLLVCDRNHYYYERWIEDQSVGGQFAMSGKNVLGDFNEIKKLYSQEEQRKFIAVPNVITKMSELWGVK